MDGSYEHIIIGGGLAGSVSAYHLAEHGSTLLLERDKIASGSSGAPSGLVNPFMARKANPVWRWKEAIDAFEGLVSETGLSGCYQQTGVLRPAAALPQKMLFRDVARAFPDEASWLQPHMVKERWPAVSAANGALFIRRGGGVEMEALVRGVARAAEDRGCEVKTGCSVTSIKNDGDFVVVASRDGEYRGRRVLLSVGGTYGAWPQLKSLPVHLIKGQLIETPIPTDLSSEIPCLSGAGYIVRHSKRLILGSTFRHTFDSLEPTTEDTEEIIRKTATLLPVVQVTPVKRAWTGIRVTVPGTRLPLVGPVEKTGKLWVFTGLGSKGLLMGALIGAHMPSYFREPTSIPREISLS